MAGTSWIARGTEFLIEARDELARVTWPDRAQLRQATITIIGFTLVIGGFIAILDVILQTLLVRAIPALFGA